MTLPFLQKHAARQEIHVLFHEHYHCIFCGQQGGAHTSDTHKILERYYAEARSAARNPVPDERIFSGPKDENRAERGVSEEFSKNLLGWQLATKGISVE